MKLYLLSQTKNNDYDTYSACIVCAENEESAKLIRPDSCRWEDGFSYSWITKIDDIKVKFLGEAEETLKEGIVLSSFHAG